MGDIADAMLEGAGCSGCGVHFEEEHGYPVLCDACWKSWTPAERRGYQRATRAEL